MEYNELDQFFRRNEEWDESVERPSLPVKPVGVPGASLPMQMTPEHIKSKILAQPLQASPLRGKAPKPINKIDETSQIDIGEELSGFGLQGVKVTEDELRDMIEQLGLGGDEAEDLLQGLSDNTQKTASKGLDKGKEKGKEVAESEGDVKGAGDIKKVIKEAETSKGDAEQVEAKKGDVKEHEKPEITG